MRRSFPRRLCPSPRFCEKAHRKDGLQSAFVLILWSKDRVLGGLVFGSGSAEFSTRGHHLLIAVGSQISKYRFPRFFCM